MKKYTKYPERYFSEDDRQMRERHEKRFSTPWKCKSKSQRGTTSYPLEWLLYRMRIISQ